MGATWEIVLIALVAIFLVLRLRSVLGRRTGNERPPTREPFTPPPPGETKPGWQSGNRPADAPSSGNGNVVELPFPERAGGPAQPLGRFDIAEKASKGIDWIAQADPTFTPHEFLVGARDAFEMIVGAYARGDSAALRPLLSDQLFASFDGAIRARQEARQTQQTTIIGFETCEFADADMRDRVAVCTVRFVTEQVNVTRNSEGAVIEGNPNEVTKVTDIWTFERDTRSPDPNWQLVATGDD